MKNFLKKLSIFFLPIILILVLVISLDIFKVFWEYDNYYRDNFVTLNRDYVCTRTYEKFRKKKKFNAFIFGSSRSHAYKTPQWKMHLPDNAIPFHYDSSGEGVYGVSKKIEYIDELGDTIEHALIIIDRKFIKYTKNKKGHLFMTSPSLSKESWVSFYTTFIKASLNLKFLAAYIDYSLFKVHRSYMGNLIRHTKYPHTVNKYTCDMYYGYDKHLKEDAQGYYNVLLKKGVFYSRPRKKKIKKVKITKLEVKQFKAISKIFKKHKTDYRIVISPMYDQIPFEKSQLQLLHKIFGKDYVFDFSGKNTFTENIRNYYETSHYRPHVANKIMKIIYKK